MRSLGRAAWIATAGVALAVAATPAFADHERAISADGMPAVAASCYRLQSFGNASYVQRTPQGAYRASASAAGAEAFRMQPSGLGRYLLIDEQSHFLTGGPGPVVRSAAAGSTGSDWQVLGSSRGSVLITSPRLREAVGVAGADGRLGLVNPDTTGYRARFRAVPIAKCAAAPEVETNVTGPQSTGATPFSTTRGFLDTHVHLMAFEFLGGSVHCGKPWDNQGVTVALRDCPDHYVPPNGAGAVLENFLRYGRPVGTHDPVGWPTFKDWPAPHSLTHEQTYYKWIERAWRGGQRMMVNLLVDNEVLCNIYPLKKNPCNDMNSVRLEARRTHELEAYIDAQNGGPGKGWFRVVTDPFQARRVINQGKLAVVMGVEVSRLFGCGERNDVPQCDRADIDRQLDEVYGLGVRDLELVNKFDNGLGGVAFDSGALGVLTNEGNKLETGHFFEAQTCPTKDAADRTLDPNGPDGRDALLGAGLQAYLPPATLPVYPPPPHCNVRGLTEMGEYLVRQMMKKGMIIDPDHLSVKARKQLLSIVEAERYSGVVSSHSWSDNPADVRILRAGGVIGPYAGDSKGYVENWQRLRKIKDPRYYYGIGFGPDMNGFGAQGDARHGPNPVTYPFKSFDGKQTIDRQRSGSRVFDINVDGVAHYGLYPDWVEDTRHIAGNAIVNDLARGPEAYLQMWERASGVPRHQCIAQRAPSGAKGIARVRLRLTADRLLRLAGQPDTRTDGLTWRWCIKGNRGARVTAVLSRRGVVQLVFSTARLHIGGKLRTGQAASRLRRVGARSIGSGVSLGRVVSSSGRLVYGTRKGRITFVGVVDRRLGKAAIRRAVRLGLRKTRLT